MHTMDGYPAQFWPDCGMLMFGHNKGAVRLADSLTQLKRERRASINERARRGAPDFNYGYIKVPR